MSGPRFMAVLLLLLAAPACRSSTQLQQSYARLNAYGSADQEAVVAEVATLPYKKNRWDHRFADWPIKRLSIGRENLFIETPDFKVACINRFDGLTKWVFEIPTRSPLEWTPAEPGEVYEQIRMYSQQLAAQTRVVEDLLKTEGLGQKAQDAQREKNRLYQLLNASQRGDNVYLVSRQVLYCIARQTGKLLWQRPLPFSPSAKAYATRESIFIPAGDRPQVWRLDVEKRGEPLQSFPANVGTGDRTIMNSPILDGIFLYFVCADGHCYCYNINNGDLEWAFPAHSKLATEPTLHTVREKFKDSAGRDTVREKKYLFFGGLDYALYCIDPGTGGLNWKYETGGFLRTPIHVKDTTVYVKSDEGALFALELDPQHRNPKTGALEGPVRTGNLRWKLPLGERFLVKGGSDRVLVLGPNSEIYQYAEMSGEIVSRTQLREITHVLTNPWDSILYVATDAGSVFALEESGSSY
jgi:outer membrane protein assembly factor BamB